MCNLVLIKMVRNNSIWTNTSMGIALNEGGHTIVSNVIQAAGNITIWNCLDATRLSMMISDLGLVVSLGRRYWNFIDDFI